MVRRCRLGDSERALVSRLVGILLLRRFVVFRPRQLLMLGDVNSKFRDSVQFLHRSSPWVTIPTVNRKGGEGNADCHVRRATRRQNRMEGVAKKNPRTYHSLSEALHYAGYVSNHMYSAGILDASAAGRRTLAGANVEVSDEKGDSRNGHDGGKEESVYKDLKQ